MTPSTLVHIAIAKIDTERMMWMSLFATGSCFWQFPPPPSYSVVNKDTERRDSLAGLHKQELEQETTEGTHTATEQVLM